MTGIRLYIALGVGGVIILLLAWALRLDSLRAHYAEALATTKANYMQAQATAQFKFDAEQARHLAAEKERNNVTDTKTAAAVTVYRDRVVRLPAAPATCSASGPAMPKADLPTRVDGPGADSILLARSDVLICADNTARLSSAQAWALDNLDDKVAK